MWLRRLPPLLPCDPQQWFRYDDHVKQVSRIIQIETGPDRGTDRISSS